VAGIEGGLSTRQSPPYLYGLGVRDGLAERLAVDLEHRIAPDDQAVLAPVRDGRSLALGDGDNGLRGVESIEVFAYAADNDRGIEPGVTKDAEPGGGAGSEDQSE
jgi:hypothetical protein